MPHLYFFSAVAGEQSIPEVVDSMSYGSSGSAGHNITITLPMYQGNRLILWVTANNSSLTSITDAITQTGLTWTQVPGSHCNNSTGDISGEVWYSSVIPATTPGTSLEFSYNGDASDDLAVSILEVEDLFSDAGSPVDDVRTYSSGAIQNPAQTNAYSVSPPGDYFLTAFWCIKHDGTTAASVTEDFQIETAQPSNSSGIDGNLNVTTWKVSTGTGANPTLALSTSRRTLSVQISWKNGNSG